MAEIIKSVTINSVSMQVSAADVMPVLRGQGGGGPALPEFAVHLVAEWVPAGVAGS